MQNQNELKSENNKELPINNSIIEIKDTIIKTVKGAIDTSKYLYRLNISDKKINTGSLSITIKLQSKESNSINKNLIFVINYDKKSNLFNVTILTFEKNNAFVLFATTEEYPVQKLTKYIPRIIESTENMMVKSSSK